MVIAYGANWLTNWLAKRLVRVDTVTLVNLVSDVLDLTRFDSGKVDLNEAEVSLAQVMMDEYRQFQQAAKDKRLAFHCEPPHRGASARQAIVGGREPAVLLERLVGVWRGFLPSRPHTTRAGSTAKRWAARR